MLQTHQLQLSVRLVNLAPQVRVNVKSVQRVSIVRRGHPIQPNAKPGLTRQVSQANVRSVKLVTSVQ